MKELKKEYNESCKTSEYKRANKLENYTIELLDSLFVYDKDTGVVCKRFQKANRPVVDTDGGILTRINGKFCRISYAKLAWVLHHREFPTSQVYKIDKRIKDVSQYCIANLTVCLDDLVKPEIVHVEFNKNMGSTTVKFIDKNKLKKQKTFKDERTMQWFLTTFDNPTIKYKIK